MPFRANLEDSALIPARSADPLLSAVDNRSDFNQPHEYPAETAGTCIAKARGDVRNSLVGLRKEMAGRIEANFRYYFTITGASLCEMTLQRTSTYSQSGRDAWKGDVTLS